MHPIIVEDSTEYYECRITTPIQEQVALNLCLNCLEWTPREYPLSDNELKWQKTLYPTVKASRYFDPPTTKAELSNYLLNEREGGDYELWLLYHLEIPVHRINTFRYESPGSHPLDTVRTIRGRGHTRIYDCLAILSASQEPRDSLVVSCDALCRDPWASTAVCALWASTALQRLSEGLGGANEIGIIVHEDDTPLQREMKRQGFFAFQYDPLCHDIHFGKVLLPRSRQSQFSTLTE